MNDKDLKHLVNFLPDLGDEKNPQYDFSNLGLKTYSGESYLPYFIVYRLKDKPLKMDCFITLFDLYKFISANFESWSFYSVGRCLESYYNDK